MKRALSCRYRARLSWTQATSWASMACLAACPGEVGRYAGVPEAVCIPMHALEKSFPGAAQARHIKFSWSCSSSSFPGAAQTRRIVDTRCVLAAGILCTSCARSARAGRSQAAICAQHSQSCLHQGLSLCF